MKGERVGDDNPQILLFFDFMCFDTSDLKLYVASVHQRSGSVMSRKLCRHEGTEEGSFVLGFSAE